MERYQDNDDVKLTILVQSVSVSGYQGEVTESTEVRLNAV